MLEMRITSISIHSQIPTAFLDRCLSAQDLQRFACLVFSGSAEQSPSHSLFMYTHLLCVYVALSIKASTSF